mgnify:FL=1
MLKNYLFTFLLSMVPVIELRGAIPYGLAHDLEPWLVYALSVVGNLLPVPFILLFVRRVLAWMKTRPRLCRLAEKIEARGRSKSKKVKKSETVGLCLFVAIPLPGTGAWTGALVAALMKMRLMRALPTIFLGVLLAGLAVTLIMTLGITALDFLVG